MIRAYDERLVEDAMSALGDVFDLALRQERLDPTEFSRKFVDSDVCSGLETGFLRFLDGVSAQDSLGRILGREIIQTSYIEYGREYWSGYILAYVNWYTNMTFRTIFERIPLERILMMYSPLHEADLSKSLEVIMEAMELENPLARMRRRSGMSQEQLSERSGVSIRSIRAYEQGQISLRAARADTVYCLSRALRCTMDDLVRSDKI